VAAGGAEVEVDVDTGKIKLLKYASAVDVGKALNPLACRQQLSGAAITGIGQAMFEEIAYDNGQLINPNFVDYVLPSLGDMPAVIDSISIEVPHKDGPFGAKGIGESALIPVAPAIANAIYIANFGYAPPASIRQFVQDVLTTRPGWNIIIVGNGVGLLFAILVLTISVVSFPLLLDRDVGAAVALLTSIRAVARNPVTMAVWGLIVAANGVATSNSDMTQAKQGQVRFSLRGVEPCRRQPEAADDNDILMSDSSTTVPGGRAV